MAHPIVLVRGPRGCAFVLTLVNWSASVCEVIEIERLTAHTVDPIAVRSATVHRHDVFTAQKGIQTGDCPDWSEMTPFVPPLQY
jgi:hypothetical protein